MPQMAPMWWTSILMITLLLMMLSMVFSYFMMSKKIKMNMETNQKKFNWKW